MILYFILLIILLGLLIVLYFNRPIFFISPVNIFILFYVLSLVNTSLYHFLVPKKDKFNYFKLDEISFNTFISTSNVFILLLICFVFGAIIFNLSSRTYSRLNKVKVKSLMINFGKFLNLQTLAAILVFLLVISSTLYIWDYGMGMFNRTEYLPEQKFKNLYKVIFLIIPLLAGVILIKYPALSIFSIIWLLIFTLAMGSRLASATLILYLIPVFLQINNRSRVILFFVIMPFVLIFLGINLGLRSESNSHGLIPYSKAVIEKPGEFLAYSFQSMYYTNIFGFYATARTIEMYGEPNFSYLITAINPLPGRFTRWYDIYENLRINRLAPYTGIGELYRYSLFFYLYFFLQGVIFAYIEVKIRYLLEENKYILPLILLLLLTLCTINLFEYNLRSSIRYVYYSLAIYLAYRVLRKIKPIKLYA